LEGFVGCEKAKESESSETPVIGYKVPGAEFEAICVICEIRGFFEER
jgi:hypothetical protein